MTNRSNIATKKAQKYQLNNALKKKIRPYLHDMIDDYQVHGKFI